MNDIHVHDLSAPGTPADAPVVLAVHGITANGLSWGPVAAELVRRHAGRVRVLAPDLRGRADSRDAGGPYGLAAHAADLAWLAAGMPSAPVLVGHSMGAFICALALVRHSDAFHAAVLVDGGLAFPAPADLDVDAALQAVIGPAMERLGMRFGDRAAYEEFWRGHPALGPSLTGPDADAVRTYIQHDLVEDDGAWRSSCVLDAIRADGRDVMADEETLTAARAAVVAGKHVELVWAARGLLDEPQGLYDEARITALDLPPSIAVTPAPDANHYTVILEPNGVTVVCDAVDRALGVGR